MTSWRIAKIDRVTACVSVSRGSQPCHLSRCNMHTMAALLSQHTEIMKTSMVKGEKLC